MCRWRSDHNKPLFHQSGFQTDVWGPVFLNPIHLNPALRKPSALEPWYTLKSSTTPSTDASTKFFIPTGFGFSGTYSRNGQAPVKGIICSSTETHSGQTWRWQPLRMRFLKGLTFQNLSVFQFSCETSLSMNTFRSLRSLKNRSRFIVSVMAEIRRASDQNILVCG